MGASTRHVADRPITGEEFERMFAKVPGVVLAKRKPAG